MISDNFPPHIATLFAKALYFSCYFHFSAFSAHPLRSPSAVACFAIYLHFTAAVQVPFKCCYSHFINLYFSYRQSFKRFIFTIHRTKFALYKRKKLSIVRPKSFLSVFLQFSSSSVRICSLSTGSARPAESFMTAPTSWRTAVFLPPR